MQLADVKRQGYKKREFTQEMKKYVWIENYKLLVFGN